MRTQPPRGVVRGQGLVVNSDHHDYHTTTDAPVTTADTVSTYHTQLLLACNQALYLDPFHIDIHTQRRRALGRVRPTVVRENTRHSTNFSAECISHLRSGRPAAPAPKKNPSKKTMNKPIIKTTPAAAAAATTTTPPRLTTRFHPTTITK